jgi:hypothetical protein
MEAVMSQISRWAFWFAVWSLPVSALPFLAYHVRDPGPTLLFMAATAMVAAALGAVAEGRRWALRTLVGAPLAGAAYGTMVAMIAAPPYCLVGTIVGLCASVPYVPAMLLAAWLAERPAARVVRPISRVVAAARPVHLGHPYRGAPIVPDEPVPNLRPSGAESAAVITLSVLGIVFFWPILLALIGFVATLVG